MTDYMATPAEREKHPNALRFFEAVAEGDANVLAFLWAMWNFSQAFDDLVDGDKPLTPEGKAQTFKALHDFITELMLNPFVQTFKPQLHVMMVSMMTRCLDGDEMEAQGNPVAPAVRCGDVDLAMMVAYLHKGWPRLRELAEFRKYDTKD